MRDGADIIQLRASILLANSLKFADVGGSNEGAELFHEGLEGLIAVTRIKDHRGIPQLACVGVIFIQDTAKDNNNNLVH